MGRRLTMSPGRQYAITCETGLKSRRKAIFSALGFEFASTIAIWNIFTRASENVLRAASFRGSQFPFAEAKLPSDPAKKRSNQRSDVSQAVTHSLKKCDGADVSLSRADHTDLRRT